MTLDPIAVLEAGYRHAGDMSTWFGDVIASVKPVMDRGLGFIGYRVSLVSWNLEFYNHGASPRMRALVEHGAANASPRASVLALPDPAGLFATSEVFGRSRHPTGADSLALSMPSGGPELHVLVAESPRFETVDPSTRTLWSHLALHLGAGIRLQQHAGTLHDPEVEAILEPDGRLLDASQVVSEPSRERLRTLTREIDRIRARRSTTWLEALEIWGGLLLGRWSLVDQFDTDGRRFVVARRNAPDAPGPRTLTRRQRQVAFYAGLGLPNKQIGYALGLSETTIATHLAHVLARLGMASRSELVRLVAGLSGSMN